MLVSGSVTYSTSTDPFDLNFAGERDPPPSLTTNQSARWGQEPGIATPRAIAATVPLGRPPSQYHWQTQV